MTTKFEKKFSQIHKNKFGIFTNSGTSALQASIHALKILGNWQDGDEVIIPATTFVATYNVVLHNNLKPVLVDIGYDFNINPDLIKEKITERTRLIIPVHLLGKPAKMNEIMKIAKQYKLKVIEDSCETMFVDEIGVGDVTCFSFYVAHLLVTGVGGMAITNDEKLAKLIRSLIFHGRDNNYLSIDDDDDLTPSKLMKVIESRFKFNHPGYSYRGTEMEAALGLAELEIHKQMMTKRQNNALYLYQKLYGNKVVREDDYYKNHAFMMFPYPSKKRDKLMLHMEKKGITTRTLMPLITQPYIHVNQEDYPRSMNVAKYFLLFGCHQDLTKKELDYIVKTIKEFDET